MKGLVSVGSDTGPRMTMTRYVLCLLLCINGILAVTGDFDIQSGSYEFIYHSNQDLLLTIHDKNCYHSEIRDVSCPQLLEAQVMIQVRYGEHIKSSNLNELRNKFQDLLANFHCLDKNIYSLEIDSDFDCDGGGHDGDRK